MSTHPGAIELRHLRCFVALAEELHFGHAAARCNVSQPPFSVAIRQLESHLGARLFVRSSRRVELTESGRAFYRQARALLDRAQGAFAEAQARAGGVRPVLHARMRGLRDLRFENPARMRDSFAEHTAICTAIRNADENAAADAMALHISTGSRSLEDIIATMG